MSREASFHLNRSIRPAFSHKLTTNYIMGNEIFWPKIIFQESRFQCWVIWIWGLRFQQNKFSKKSCPFWAIFQWQWILHHITKSKYHKPSTSIFIYIFAHVLIKYFWTERYIFNFICCTEWLLLFVCKWARTEKLPTVNPLSPKAGILKVCVV